jgi:hypothetical protein
LGNARDRDKRKQGHGARPVAGGLEPDGPGLNPDSVLTGCVT